MHVYVCVSRGTFGPFFFKQELIIEKNYGRCIYESVDCKNLSLLRFISKISVKIKYMRLRLNNMWSITNKMIIT